MRRLGCDDAVRLAEELSEMLDAFHDSPWLFLGKKAGETSHFLWVKRATVEPGTAVAGVLAYSFVLGLLCQWRVQSENGFRN
jgi:hypothetical protein